MFSDPDRLPASTMTTASAAAARRRLRWALDVASAGGEIVDLPETDMAELPDLGTGFNTATAWRHELARLRGVVRTE